MVNEAFLEIPGVTEQKAEELHRHGFHNPTALRHATQAEIAETPGIGMALSARIKAYLGAEEALNGPEMEEEPDPPYLAMDRNLDSVTLLMVVYESDRLANEVYVDEGETVASWDGNEGYPEDDNVVGAFFVRGCSEAKSRFQTPIYDFPKSRLKPLAGVVEPGKEPEGEPEPIKGFGGCEECGEAVTEQSNEYIEEGESVFCDIACYNNYL